MFINIRLSSFHFSFHKDIIDHKDILLVSFFNKGIMYWIMNIYSDLSHNAIKYLKNMELNLRNLLIMTKDFNICDNLWDPSFNYYSFTSDDLFAIVDSLDLFLFFSPDPVPTRYSDNPNDSNSVIDLIFLHYNSSEINMHIIYSEWQLTSDYTPLMIIISIICYMQVHLSRNYIPAVKSPPNHASLPSMVATFLATYLMVVLQLSVYSIFHGRDTSIRLGLL